MLMNLAGVTWCHALYLVPGGWEEATVSWRKVVAGCVLGLLAVVPASMGQTDPIQAQINEITAPAQGVKWGYDLRVREEYARNCFDANDDVPAEDTVNVFRFRNRLWVELGPYLNVEGPGTYANNGVTIYARLVYEPQVYTFYQDSRNEQHPTMWNEVALDNLYVNFDHFLSMPVSLKVGRQDMMYGKGLVMGEGTPLDGGRTIFFDAIKGTIHVDPLQTNIDIFYANNKARESRVAPLNVASGPYLSEFNSDVFGIYAINRSLEGQEFHAYYVYHHDERVIPNPVLPAKKDISTMGALAQGTLPRGFDYYAEFAGQWGNLDGKPMGDAWAFSSDIGYTVEGTQATPVRVHAGYEYLSGNDKGAVRNHGWDSTFSRFPRWSELYARMWTGETGMIAFETNLQRYIAGASYRPITDLLFTFDYNLLLNNNTTGPTPGFLSGKGQTRGNLFMGKAFYRITPYISSHVWAECLLPSRTYVSNADPSWFLRWEITFTLANQPPKKK